MPKLLITAILLLSVLTSIAQQPVLDWAVAFNSNNTSNPTVNNNGRTIGIDEQGNVYSAGLFEHSVDFDPGPNVYTMVGASEYKYGIYISKLDADGNFLWAVQIPTSVSFGQIELKVDKAGNVYLASDLNGAADMDPGPGVLMMNPTGFRDAFVIKLNTNGMLVWAKQFGGPGDTGPQANMLELDKNNNVIIGGVFNNTVDFDPGPGILNITSSAHMQAFIVKLDNDGSLIWAKQFGNGPEVYSGCGITDIKCDAQGNIFTIGQFARTCDFDPGPGVYNVTSSPGSTVDGFICKLDGDANFVWVKTIGQTSGYNGFIQPTGIDIDGMNNIVMSGFFIGDLDFDPGSGVQKFSSNPYDCYILKLDRQGNFIWVKVIGGADMDTGNDVVVDAANNVYIIGSFGPKVDFDPGEGSHIITSPYYGAEAVIKLTPEGNFVYVAPFQSISHGTGLFRRMTIDAALNIYVVGSVSGTVDFDPGPAVFPLSGSSNSAPFVLKLGLCVNATASTLNINTCNSYTLNSQTYDSTGTYLQTTLNAAGCDSLITLNLTINKKLTVQTKTICDGEIFFAGGVNRITSGIYYDTLQTNLGCDSVVRTHLTVNPKPSPDLGKDMNICRNIELNLSPGTFATYLWQDNSNTPTLNTHSAGAYWVKVTNDFNCEATDTMNVISILEPPVGFLKQTDSICSYEDLKLSPFSSYPNYKWSTGESTKDIQVRNAGIYTLTVIDANGCTGIDTTIVFGKDCMAGIYVPNAFTPDGNGKNDIFKPIIYTRLIKYRLVIYNRFGALVFETTEPDKGWDGTIGGAKQNPGSFVWVLFYQSEGGEPRTEKGTITLIR